MSATGVIVVRVATWLVSFLILFSPDAGWEAGSRNEVQACSWASCSASGSPSCLWSMLPSFLYLRGFHPFLTSMEIPADLA